MSNENADSKTTFDLFLKTPSDYEAAIHVSIDDVPDELDGDGKARNRVVAMMAYMARLDKQLSQAGFKRSERLDKPPRGGGGRPPQPAPTIEAPDGQKIVVKCGVCGNDVWDNREGKMNPKSPDFKCKNKACAAVAWLPKDEGEAMTWKQ